MRITFASLGVVCVIAAASGAAERAAADTAGGATKTTAVRQLDWQADLRLRAEVVTYDQDVAPGEELTTVLRLRIRARLGFETELAKGLTFGARVATGSNNPTSGNVTLGDLFGKKAIGADRAYLRYQPGPALRMLGGKFPSPLFDRQLLWDTDVSPEGLAETVSRELGAVTLSATAAQLVLGDLDTTKDPWVFVGQVDAMVEPDAPVEFEIGLAYYHYIFLDSAALPYNQGTNSQDDQGILTVPFRVLVGLIGARVETGWAPVAAHVELSRNLAADTREDGAQLELRVGVNQVGGDLSAGYAIQRLERDATLDALAESHWHKQRTNYMGHALNGKLSLAANWRVSSSFKVMQSLDGPRDDELRWTVDMIGEL